MLKTTRRKMRIRKNNMEMRVKLMRARTVNLAQNSHLTIRMTPQQKKAEIMPPEKY